MRALLLALGLMLTACAPAPPNPDAARDALILAVEAYERAQIEGDGDAIRLLVADDYVLVGGDGARSTRDDLIAFWTAEGFDPLPVAVSDPVELFWQDGAAMGGLVTLTGTRNGEPFSMTMRYIDVWALRDGAWVVVYGQTTRVQ